jgi:hypothetical protein
MVRSGLAVLAFCLACVHAAHAVVVTPVELTELIEMSRVIVHGTVSDVQPQLALDRRRVETIVSLDVSAYLKGGLGPDLTFRLPGGQFGRYRTIVPGAPAFAVGDEVVLFLGLDGPAFPYIVGLSQGVVRVAVDEQTGEKRVSAPPAASGSDLPKAIVRGDPSRAPVPLAEFLANVRSLAGAGR